MGSDGVFISDYWKPATTFPSLGSLVSNFLPKVLLLGGIISFILVIIAGVGMVSGAGSGDAHAAESRQKILTYAILGLIIMFGAYWILQLINYLTLGSLGGIVR